MCQWFIALNHWTAFHSVHITCSVSQFIHWCLESFHLFYPEKAQVSVSRPRGLYPSCRQFCWFCGQTHPAQETWRGRRCLWHKSVTKALIQSSSSFSKTNASIRFPPEPISRALKLWILMILTSWIQRNHWSLPAIIIDTHMSLLFWSILKIGTKTWFSMRTNIKALHQV